MRARLRRDGREFPGELEPLEPPPSFVGEALKSILGALVAIALGFAISTYLGTLLVEGRLW